MWYEDPHKITWEQVGGEDVSLQSVRDFFKTHFPERDFGDDFAEILIRLKRDRFREKLTPLEALVVGISQGFVPERRP